MRDKPFSFHTIEDSNLMAEWFRHADKFQEIAQDIPTARKLVSEAEAALKVAMAEAAKEIRKNPADFDITKGTEKEIEAEVILHPKVTKARGQLIAAEYSLDIHNTAVSIMETRRRTLENAVELHGMNYFGQPKASEQAREKLNDASKGSTYKSASERMTRKKAPDRRTRKDDDD